MDEKRRIKSVRLAVPELVLGNGIRMQIVFREKKKIEGKKYVRFAVRPTDGFLQKYNLPNKPYYIKDFPEELIREGEQDPYVMRATFVACGWNKEPEALMEWNGALFSELKEMKTENCLLKAQNFRLSEKYRKVTSRPLEESEGILKEMSKWKKVLGKEVVYDEADTKKRVGL